MLLTRLRDLVVLTMITVTAGYGFEQSRLE